MTDLISTLDLAKMLHISRSTLYDLRKKNDFFEPVRLSRGRIAWRISDAEAWLATR